VIMCFRQAKKGHALGFNRINGQADFTTGYNYDAVGRVTSLLQTGTGVTTKRVDLFYNPDSQIATITRYTDMSATQPVATTTFDSYDALGRLTQLTNRNTATMINYRWQLDIGDRLLQSVSTLDGTITYQSDADDEESSVTYTDGQAAENYTFDQNGNRSGPSYTVAADNRPACPAFSIQRAIRTRGGQQASRGDGPARGEIGEGINFGGRWR